MPDIWFPYLGIKVSVSKTAFSIFGFDIAWYGIIIAIGVFAGLMLARRLARKSGQDPELYLDFLIYALIFAIIGARLYYVIFEWDQYAGNLKDILNLRKGGLAIYGGVIGAILTAVVYCKVKHYSLLQLMDTAMPGLILGQAIGRWGNFFNQEAFGGYTDNFFAMRLNMDTAAYVPTELMKKTVTVEGVRYIQVHPTFLYESMWCLLVLAVMLILWKHRKFKGQIAFTYMIGYGLGRMFIETLRTDQLILWNTSIPVSVLVSAVMMLCGIVLMVIFARRAQVEKQKLAMADIHYAPDDASSSGDLDDLAGSGEPEADEDEPAETGTDPDSEPRKKLTDEDLWD